MSELVKKIEAILQLELNPPPEQYDDLIAWVMRFKENFPKYALDPQGHIVGSTSPKRS